MTDADEHPTPMAEEPFRREFSRPPQPTGVIGLGVQVCVCSASQEREREKKGGVGVVVVVVVVSGVVE